MRRLHRSGSGSASTAFANGGSASTQTASGHPQSHQGRLTVEGGKRDTQDALTAILAKKASHHRPTSPTILSSSARPRHPLQVPAHSDNPGSGQLVASYNRPGSPQPCKEKHNGNQPLGK